MIFAIIGVVGLYWAKLHSFLLFHGIVELFGIVVSGCIFVIAWNGRKLHANFALTLLGIAYLAIGVIDLLHMLAYRGMGVFPGIGPNPATQLWIGSRYLISISLLLMAIAPMKAVARRGAAWFALASYTIISALVILSIFYWHIFPDCFVDGQGLTRFKRVSEYVCCGLILFAMLLLWRRRGEMDRRLIFLMLLSMFASVGSGLAFTLYSDPFALWNWTGHVLKLISYFLVYEAIVVTAMERPLSVMVRDLKENETALLSANRKAEAANAAKDRFLAVLSHELRTPLAPVLLTLSSYENDDRLPAQVREDLRTAKRNIALESHLIDDLLDLNRIAAGKLTLRIEDVDVLSVVRDAARSCEPEALTKGVQFDVDFGALANQSAMLKGDAGRLQQVIWNLLKNAIKFTPKGGQVHVSAEMSDNAPGLLRIIVRDTGIGIAAESITNIFNAFEQADEQVTRQYGGLGLGLPIARAITSLHHGNIHAQSAGPGQGATFTLELPAVIQPAATTLLSSSVKTMSTQGNKPSPMPSNSEISSGKRVLVVEDHPDTARLLARLLKLHGFNVTAANSAAEALKIFESQKAIGQPFEFVLSDIGLPDVSGYDFIKSIRQLDSKVPAIAMSGFGMETDVNRSLQAGFGEHLVKPVAIDQLLQAIARQSSSGDS